MDSSDEHARRLLILRLVCKEDCELLWGWANDPDVRASAFSSGLISWKEHKLWFARKRVDSSCFIFIGLDNFGVPVGQVRFDVKKGGNEMLIDVSIDRDRRGQGYGSLLLDLSVEEIFRTTSIRKVCALVKSDNKRSEKVFERAGFKRFESLQVEGCSVTCFGRGV